MDLVNIGFLAGNIRLRRDSIMSNAEISQPQTSLLKQHPSGVKLCLVLAGFSLLRYTKGQFWVVGLIASFLLFSVGTCVG